MNLKQLQVLAVEIRVKYDQLNQQKRDLTWNEQQLMAGFVGDVGDLSKIIQAKHGLRPMDDIDEKLAHEHCGNNTDDRFGLKKQSINTDFKLFP